MPGQPIWHIEQRFAVLLHRQDELPADLADDPGGDQLAVQIDLAEHGQTVD
jgi:hypothetical protein